MLNRRCVTASLLSFFLLPLAALGQQPAPAAPVTPSPNLAGLAHVAIRVKDLDASVAFYEKLGFVRAFALSKNDKVYEAFIKINDQQYIELYPVDETNTQVGFLHVCFYGDNLQAAHDYYVKQGLKPNDVRTAGAGNLLFTMPGPETPTGPQNLEYTQYMPGSRHSKAIGQFLGPDRVSTKLVGVVVAFIDTAQAAAFYKDKLGFKPGKNDNANLFDLPGNPSEGVRAVSAAKIGMKAILAFAGDKDDAAKLKKHGVAYEDGSAFGKPEDLTMNDPDGNWIVLRNANKP